jgi:hypothetical protein
VIKQAARSFARWFVVLAAITLVGCAMPPEEAIKPTIQTYAEDYQALFNLSTAKRCFASKAGVYRSGAVDAIFLPRSDTPVDASRGWPWQRQLLRLRPIEKQPSGSKQ